ncbi:MAG: hypothetical protein Q4P34_04960 [Tissierellia bacterium]|nr:hypothetical protein [Tissierellia bacterium]
MKNFLIILAIVLSLSSVSCSNYKKDDSDSAKEIKIDLKKKTIGTKKMGLGYKSRSKSRELEEDKEEAVDFSIAVAAIGMDDEGKITSISIDDVSRMVDSDIDSEKSKSLNEEYRTKKEAGNEYGMKEYSGIGREWHEQIKSFEDWMMGKKIEDVLNMEYKEGENGKKIPDDVDLVSSVTIDVGRYLDAIENASINAEEIKSASKIGLGILSEIESSDEDNLKLRGLETSFAAVALDSEGKIVKSLIDVIDKKYLFDDEGELESDVDEELKSKKSLGDSYGLKEYSGIKREWYEQIGDFSEWTRGRTADEIKGIKMAKVKDKSVPRDTDLISSVTISISNIQKALLKAIENSK